MKARHFFLFSLALVSTFTVPLTAFAIGLAVSPSSLALQSVTGKLVEATLTVENDSDEVAYFEAYPDAFGSVFTVSPKSFTLEAKETRTLTLRAHSERNGQFSTELSVVARPLDESVYQAAGGIKLPLALSVSERDTGLAASALSAMTAPPALLISALLVIAAVLLAYRRRRSPA